MNSKRNLILKKETKIFRGIVDKFYDEYPAKRYHILLLIYLAKNGYLEIEENHNGKSKIIAHLEPGSYASVNSGEIVKYNGKPLYLLASIPDEIKNIYEELDYGLDVDAIKRMEEDNEMWLDFSDSFYKYMLFEIAENLLSFSDDWFENELKNQIYYIFTKEKDPEMGNLKFFSTALKLLDIYEGTIYNPYANSCTFHISNPNSVKLDSQFSSSLYVVGKIMDLIFNRTNNSFEMEDSLSQWKGDKGYDYFISIPPFKSCDSKYKYIEKDYLIRSAFDTRKKAIGIYSYDIFSNENEYSKSLKSIIGNDWLEAVILLPLKKSDKWLGGNCIVLINKEKELKGKIKFIDFSKPTITSGEGESDEIDNVYNPDDLYSLYQSHSSSEKMAIVSNSDVIENGCQLYPKIYTLNEPIDVPDGMKLVKLRDLLVPTKCFDCVDSEYKVFSYSKEDLGKVCDANKFELKNIETERYRCFNEDSIIIPFNYPFFSCYVKTNGENIAIASHESAFIIKDIDSLYILFELQKEYVSQQSEKYGLDFLCTAMSYPLNLMEIQILIPIKKEDQYMCIADSIEKDYDSKIEFIKKYSKAKLDEFIRNQRQRKHSVTQVLNDFYPGLKILNNFIAANSSFTSESVINRNGTSIKDYVSNLVGIIENRLLPMVDHFTDLDKFSEPELIDVNKFLKDYCDTKKSIESYRIEYKYDSSDLSRNSMVYMPSSELHQILDNLFSNAKKYGFTNENKKIHGIKVKLEVDFNVSNLVSIKISNNGNLVSEGISLDKLFLWGVGQGSGIGCYQVKEIVEHYGGTVIYNEKPQKKDGYKCEFEIKLPLKLD